MTYHINFISFSQPNNPNLQEGVIVNLAEQNNENNYAAASVVPIRVPKKRERSPK